jgi:D-lactate dehydrogenase
MKTLVFSTQQYEQHFLQREASGKQELVFTPLSLNKDTADMTMGFSAVSLFTSDNALAKVLRLIHAHGVKYITLRSAGHDHVDLKVAKELGIKVANVPSYSPHAIAEHAVTLLLALNRKIILGQQRMKQNNYCLDDLVGFDLYGKTIGIVGTGKTGAAFATIMHGFGCKLLGYDVFQNETLIAQTGIAYHSLDDVCKNADVISIHCPLNDATRHMFNKQRFNLMKKEAFLINTARGGIIHTQDLIQALNEGKIAAVGLDVYENEKPIFFINHLERPIQDDVFKQLKSFPNVLITGHQAFLTNEALKGIAATTIDNLNKFAQDGISQNDLD